MNFFSNVLCLYKARFECNTGAVLLFKLLTNYLIEISCASCKIDKNIDTCNLLVHRDTFKLIGENPLRCKREFSRNNTF